MKKKMLEWLVCPSCRKGNFSLADAHPDDKEVESGRLICDFCKETYAVFDGIPRFVSKRGMSEKSLTGNTRKTFGKEWEIFADETYSDMAHIRRFVETAWGDISSFRNKVVIDGGCGPGYFSAVFAEEAKDVIALDLTDEGVAFTHSRIGHLPNVHVIQADLMNLPLKEGFADRISSTGVLHHTPEPYHCFNSLVSSLKPGGEIAVSVYDKYPLPARLFYQAVRKITTKLSIMSMMSISKCLVLFSYAPTRLLQWIPYPWASRWPQATYKRRLWWTYDWYSPEFVNFYSPDDIIQWFDKSGVRDFEHFPEIGGYYKGIKK